MIITNQTPDDIDWMHVGVSGCMRSGDTVEMEESRAKHILSKWGPRGLLAITLEDLNKMEPIIEKAMAIWRQFWTERVERHNQQNEARRAQNIPFNKPTKELQEHADKIGLELLKPYTIKSNDQQVAQLTDENQKLKAQIGEQGRQITDLTTKLSDFMDMFKKIKVAGVADTSTQAAEKDETAWWDEDPEKAAIRDQYKHTNKKTFQSWLEKNAHEIPMWPAEVQQDLVDRWDKYEYGEKFPYATTLK